MQVDYDRIKLHAQITNLNLDVEMFLFANDKPDS